MREFVKSEIVVPNDLELIYKREIKTLDVSELFSRKLIVYYDTLDCLSCRVARVQEYSELFVMSDTSAFSVLLIFSPKFEEMDDIRARLMQFNYDFPVYLDVNRSFCKKNPNIPSDIRFHSFLIDENGVPIYVGNPLIDQTLFDVFNTVISQTKKCY